MLSPCRSRATRASPPGWRADRADLPADLRHDMSDAVGFELLRIRPLLLHVSALSLPEGLVDLAGAAESDRLDLAEVDARLVARVLEHVERLPALEHDDLGAFELLPVERGIGRAPGQEKPSISLICAKCTAGGVSPLLSE